ESGKPAAPKAQTSALVGTPKGDEAVEARGEEPPVVARMIVEIRSDGTRTIARRALVDELTGDKVAIEAEGSSPIQLAAQLARSLITAPLAGARLAKSLGRGRTAPKEGDG